MAIVERDGELYDVIEVKIDKKRLQEEYDGNINTIASFNKDLSLLNGSLDSVPDVVKEIVNAKITEIQEHIDALEFRNNEISQWL